MNMTTEFLSLMNAGGPIMWVILVVACGAMTMLAWEALRVRALLQNAQQDYRFLRVGQNSLASISNRSSPVRQLLLAINWAETYSEEDVVKEIKINLAELSPKMTGHLSTIAVLGSLLPMLGLLGTVTGMINVFETIAINGSGKPDQMADGISQALLTTASGLIIAIPVIFLHHLLSGHIKTLVTITNQSVLVLLQRKIKDLKQDYEPEPTA